MADNLVGTVEQVIEKAQAFVDAGCREFILWFRDAPSDESAAAWITCAAENGTCTLTGTHEIAFGAAGHYVYRSVTGTTACTIRGQERL